MCIKNSKYLFKYINKKSYQVININNNINKKNI